MKKTLPIVIVGALIVTAVILATKQPPQTIQTPINQGKEASSVSQQASSSVSKAALTMADVAKHATADDCWIAVDGQIYNMTAFIAKGQHPPAIIDQCGKDGTVAFNTRGRNMPHPAKAKELLTTMLVGELAK